VIDYRKITGEFASASAVAAVMAAELLQNGEIPGPLCDSSPCQLTHKGLLVVGLGKCVTALAVFKP